MSDIATPKKTNVMVISLAVGFLKLKYTETDGRRAVRSKGVGEREMWSQATWQQVCGRAGPGVTEVSGTLWDSRPLGPDGLRGTWPASHSPLGPFSAVN